MCIHCNNLSLDDPADKAMCDTYKLLDGTADGATAFIEARKQLRAIRNLPEARHE